MIGERVDRLLPVSQSLPDNWTTIYLLASLKDDEFESIRKEKLLKPTLKALEIREHVSSRSAPRRRSAKPKSDPTEVTLDLRNVEKEERQSILNMIEKWKESIGIGVHLRP